MQIREREIEAFTAVAEHLSFTRAAEALGMSQSALSQAIARLEQRVGFQLVVRDHGPVRLSEQGRALLPEARRFIASGDALREVTHLLGRGGDGPRRPLHIGAAATVIFGLLPDAVDRLRGVAPVVSQMGEASQDRAFARGELDIGIRRTWEEGGADDRVQLFTEHLYIACRRGHPAAVAGGTLADFAQEPLLVFRRSSAPTAHDAIMQTIERAGLRIPAVRDYKDEGDFIGLVACGAGFGVVPFGMTRVRLPQIVYIRIDDPLAVTPVSLRFSLESPGAREAAEQLGGVLKELVQESSGAIPPADESRG